MKTTKLTVNFIKTDKTLGTVHTHTHTHVVLNENNNAIFASQNRKKDNL